MTITADDHDGDVRHGGGPGRLALATRITVSLLLVGALAMGLVWLVVMKGEGFENARTALVWVWGFVLVLLVVFFGHALVESWKGGS